MKFKTPGQAELGSYFCVHHGARLESAGVKVQFHYNQDPGIHLTVESPGTLVESFWGALKSGIEEGLSVRFPDFPQTASVWVTEVDAHPVSSTESAFYLVGRMVIEQAYSRCELLAGGS